jgi:hypothetical protein
MRIDTLPHQLPLRLDFDAQRRSALNSRTARILLRCSGPGDPDDCNSKHKPHNPNAHCFVPD